MYYCSLDLKVRVFFYIEILLRKLLYIQVCLYIQTLYDKPIVLIFDNTYTI